MNKFYLNTLTETVEDVLVLTETEKTNQIILFNDDINTFDFVIECLVHYCGHDYIQAEQCAYIVHYTGKCSVKKGSYRTLQPICEKLLELGLTAEIQ
jgi:ATP-dependent Clp protease adaptor protein ClpS